MSSEKKGDDDDKKKGAVLFNQEKQQSQTKSLSQFNAGTTSRIKIRRKSYGFSTVPGIKNPETAPSFGQEYKRPQLTYLNTYQLDPYVRFDPIKVKKAANELMDQVFTGKHIYNAEDSPSLALQMAADLLRTLKGFQFNRYRLLTVVTIGQKRAQSYVNAIAFLWDHERDSYMNVQREEHTCFVQITVFGVYLD